jgi:hypothetical protein
MYFCIGFFVQECFCSWNLTQYNSLQFLLGNVMVNYKPLLGIILLLALIRGIIYASLVPPWQAPDEPAQFERVRASLSSVDWRSTSANAPNWYDDLIRSLFTFNFWDFIDAPRLAYNSSFSANHYLPLYNEIYEGLYGSRLAYGVMAWPLFVVHNEDIEVQLYLVRLNTVLMNIGIIFLAFLIVQTIFPDEPFLMLGVPLLILFNPQHTYLLSTVNNGNLAELLATASLYFLIRGIVRGFSWQIIIAVLAFAMAAIWAKATAYFLPFAIATIGVFYLWRYRRHWVWFFSIAVILAGGLFYFAPARLKILMTWAWQGARSGDFYLDSIVPLDLFRSFWAMPGWTMVVLHPFWYQLLAVASILAVIGLVILVFTKYQLIFSEQFQLRIQAFSVLTVSAVAAVGILLAWNAISHSIVYRQGRSIYPVIVPICLLLMLGWRQLIPPQWRQFGLLALAMAFFSFDSLVLFNYVLPFFYTRF